MVVDYAGELIKLTDRELLLLIAGLRVVDNHLTEEKRIRLIRLTKTIEEKR